MTRRPGRRHDHDIHASPAAQLGIKTVTENVPAGWTLTDIAAPVHDDVVDDATGDFVNGGHAS